MRDTVERSRIQNPSKALSTNPPATEEAKPVMRVRRRDAGHRGAGPDRGVPVRQPRATQRAREAVQNLGLGPRHAACWRPGRLGQHHLGARRHRRDAQAKRDVRVRRWVPPPSPGIFPGSCAACEAILQMLQQMRTRRARQEEQSRSLASSSSHCQGPMREHKATSGWWRLSPGSTPMRVPASVGHGKQEGIEQHCGRRPRTWLLLLIRG
jgi:hypothetical protein